MKTTIRIFILFLAINAVTLVVPQKATAQVSINFQIFYDDLSPYGNWVNNPEYGYVWIPNVSGRFVPYGTNGHWVFSDVGWTWVSNYSWGWAPFHYGRWFYDPYYGWIWVPGYEWGPGWVTWRVSSGYYGWAPIGPGISIGIAYSNSYRLPYNQWIFVRDRDFGRPNIYNYYVPSSQNVSIINNSTVINNMRRDKGTRVRYNAGPDQREVSRRSGTAISPITLRERNRPGQQVSGRELGVYRPKVERNRGAQKPAPSKVTPLKDVKPAVQRKVRTQPQRENKQLQQQRDERPVRQQPQHGIDQKIQRNPNDQPQRQRSQQHTKEESVGQQQMQQQKEQQIRQEHAERQAKDQRARGQQIQEKRNDPREKR